MAPPSNHGIGDHEENPQMQPRSTAWDIIDYNAYLNNHEAINFDFDTDLNDPDTSGSFNDLNDSLTTQDPNGMSGFSQAFSSHTRNLVASEYCSQGHTYNIPRGCVAMEQIQPLVTPSFQTPYGNLEPQLLPADPIIAEQGQDTLEYVLDSTTPHEPKKARKIPNPSSGEWRQRKSEIRSLYFDHQYTQEATRLEMATRGFNAALPQYKRKFKEWDWGTYENSKDGGTSGETSSINKSARRSRGRASGNSSTRDSHPSSSNSTTVAAPSPSNLARVDFHSTHSDSIRSRKKTSSPPQYQHAQFSSLHLGPSVLAGIGSQSDSSHSTTRIAVTPPRSHHARFNRASSSMGMPPSISNTDFDKLMNAIIASTTDLYISYPAQNKWMFQKQCKVEEDIHDDLLVGTLTSAHNYSSLGPEVGNKGFQNALQLLGKVVGVEEGADCGLFSLPAIWVSFLRLVKEQRSDWAREFLSKASNLALRRFGRAHSFVKALSNLQKIWANEPAWVEEVVFRTYRSCIASLGETLDPLNLTYLSLWADYVVYLDGTSTNETNHVVKSIRGVIRILEEEKVPNSEPDSDYVLELFGLMLYVLQSTPTMADEAEKVAGELLIRVERKKMSAGGKLEGDLFITWKDLMQTLGTFCQDRKAYHEAKVYLEEFLCLEIADERDLLALEKLERCYLSIGRTEEAKVVKQRRMDESNKLLGKIDTDPVACGEFVNEHREISDEDGMDLSNKEESSEGTVVDQAEEDIGEGGMEEDDANEIEDAEVEQQLLREQMAESDKREQRTEIKKGLNVSELGKGKGREAATRK